MAKRTKYKFICIVVSIFLLFQYLFYSIFLKSSLNDDSRTSQDSKLRFIPNTLRFETFKDIRIPKPYTSLIKPSKIEHYEGKAIFNIGTCSYIYNFHTGYVNDIKIQSKTSLLKSMTGKSDIMIGSGKYLTYMTMLLQILEFFVNFAELNDIIYTHEGGSLLGICRDRRLLPWDDDFDIVVKESDYFKISQFFDYIEWKYDKEDLKTEFLPIKGPYIFSFGPTLKMHVALDPVKKVFKICPTEQNENRELLTAFHIDISICRNWNTTFIHKCFGEGPSRRHFGPSPFDGKDAYPTTDVCGVMSRLPKDCEIWCEDYFSKISEVIPYWREKKSPDLDQLRIERMKEMDRKNEYFNRKQNKRPEFISNLEKFYGTKITRPK